MALPFCVRSRADIWGRYLGTDGTFPSASIAALGPGYSQASRPAHSQQVGTWLSLVERTLGVGEVASSNLVVPTIYFQYFRLNSESKKIISGSFL